MDDNFVINLENFTVNDDITVNTAELSNLCTICLKPSETTPLEEINFEEQSLLSILISNVPEYNNVGSDTLPLAICSPCLVQLVTAHLFKTKALKAYNIRKVIEKMCKDDGGPNKQIFKIKKKIKQEVDDHFEIDDSNFEQDNVDNDGEREDATNLYEDEGEPNIISHLRPERTTVYNFTSPQKGRGFNDLKQFTDGVKQSFICKVCGKGFIGQEGLVEHQYSHIGAKHVCSACGKTFKSDFSLKLHIEWRCELLTGVPIKRNKIKTNPDKSVNCNICGKLLSSRSALSNHLFTHGEKKYTCSECGSKFTTESLLKIHFRCHTDERPYTCPVCEKSFKQHGTLRNHMLVHTGLRMHTCDICHKSFKQATHLYYHKRTHTGVKAYVCDHCGKAFANNGNLTVHKRLHTQEKPFACSLCDKRFYASNNLKKHMQCHIKLDPYKFNTAIRLSESGEGEEQYSIILEEGEDYVEEEEMEEEMYEEVEKTENHEEEDEKPEGEEAEEVVEEDEEQESSNQ